MSSPIHKNMDETSPHVVAAAGAGKQPQQQQQSSSVGGPHRANKPRPLNLTTTTHSDTPNQKGQNVRFQTNNAPVVVTLTIDEVLDLMHQINNGVKSGQFTTQLSDQIVQLCQQMKSLGDQLEQTNKTELNRVFVSLRQACCRDSGQLGTQCRLKMMELIELRAMGWRPSLAHSQYYLHRQQQQQQPLAVVNGNLTTHNAQHPQQHDNIIQPQQQHHATTSNNNTQHPQQQQAAVSAATAPLPFLYHHAAGGLLGAGAAAAAAFSQQQQQQQQQQHHQQQQQQQPTTTTTAYSMTGAGAASYMTQWHQQQLEHHQATAAHTTAQPLLAGTGPTPISAPPFGSVPLNPFALSGPPHPLYPPGTPQFDFAQATGNQQQNAAAAAAAASYYLVPASAGFLPPPTSVNAFMMGQAPPASPLAGAPTQSFLTAMPNLGAHANTQPSLPGLSGGMFDNLDSSALPWLKGAVVKHSGKQPQKVPGKNQYRDELMIRNADSGKIMGVKGRRVAVVEELSKTVISFQKVAQTARERTLTITGNTEQSINYAKILIEETIKRNVSPNRPESTTDESTAASSQPENGHHQSDSVDTTDNDNVFLDQGDENMNIKFETAADGTLKLSCTDPAVLQAAQDALNQYFISRVPMRRSQTGGSHQRSSNTDPDRRKSVPSFSPEVDGDLQRSVEKANAVHTGRRRRGSVHLADQEKQANQPSEADRMLNWRAQAQQRTRSTPNLVDTPNKPLPPPPEPLVRARYTRDYLLQCADAAVSKIVPVCAPKIMIDAPDIVRQNKTFLDSKNYKTNSAALAAELKSMQQQLQQPQTQS